jgi:hypothetical protein
VIVDSVPRFPFGNFSAFQPGNCLPSESSTLSFTAWTNDSFLVGSPVSVIRTFSVVESSTQFFFPQVSRSAGVESYPNGSLTLASAPSQQLLIEYQCEFPFILGEHLTFLVHGPNETFALGLYYAQNCLNYTGMKYFSIYRTNFISFANLFQACLCNLGQCDETSGTCSCPPGYYGGNCEFYLEIPDICYTEFVGFSYNGTFAGTSAYGTNW